MIYNKHLPVRRDTDEKDQKQAAAAKKMELVAHLTKTTNFLAYRLSAFWALGKQYLRRR
jgi:hypothetical protein